MVFLLILIFIFIVIFEVPKLAKDNYHREIVVFFSFLLLAFIISLLQVIGIHLPSPVKGIDYVIKNILHLNYK